MQKYINKNSQSDVCYFDDDVTVSDYISLNEYRVMTDEEIDKHENPEKYKSDEEKLADKRAAMPPLTPKQLKLALALNGISEEKVQTAIAGIKDEQTRLIAQYEWEYALSFERTNARTEMLANLVGLTPEQVDKLWEQAAAL